MKKMMEIANQQLKWEQPSAWKMHYELRAGEELVGTLHFRSSLGSFATAEHSDACWTFKRVGFWQARVTVRTCDAETDIATFKNNTWSGGGTLEFPDGRKFLATTNLWQSKLDFQDEAGATLIQFKQGGMLHLSATVDVQPEAAKSPELLLMVMLGWYLIVMMSMDAAVGAASAGAAAPG